MGSHINKDGKFQSDKYPSCPAGKVPLSVEDVTAQDLLWEYAQRRRTVDAEFADDLETCLKAAHYSPEFFEYRIWLAWFQMGESQLACARECVAKDLKETRPRLVTASFMRWLAGEEVLGSGPMSKRRPGHTFSIIIGHLHHLSYDSLHSLHEMLRHVGYREAEADQLVQAFQHMFPQVPKYAREDIASMHSRAAGSAIRYHKAISNADLRMAVMVRVGEHFDDEHYVEALTNLQRWCLKKADNGDWEYEERAAGLPKVEVLKGDAVVLVKEPFVPDEKAACETAALMREITEQRKTDAFNAALVTAARFDLKEYEDAIYGIIEQRGPVDDIDLKGGVRGLLGDAFDEGLYAEAFEVLQTTPTIRQNTSGDWEIAREPKVDT